MPVYATDNRMYLNVTGKLWISDGTDAGTDTLKGMPPDAKFGYYYPMISYHGKEYFIADDSVHGRELWVTDGTAAGTYLFMDIIKGNRSGIYNFNAIIYHDKLYFAADDFLHGVEPWITDGTTGGTYMFADINNAAGNTPSYPSAYTIFNDQLFFTASNGTGISSHQLYRTDGNPFHCNVMIPPGKTASGYIT